MVTDDTTADTSAIELLCYNLCILLPPDIDDDATLAQTAFFDGQLFGSLLVTALLFLQNFVQLREEGR